MYILSSKYTLQLCSQYTVHLHLIYVPCSKYSLQFYAQCSVHILLIKMFLIFNTLQYSPILLLKYVLKS